MDINFLVSWLDVVIAAGLVWAGWAVYKAGKRAGYKDAYQSELNYRIEDFLDKQKENSESKS